MLDPHDTIVAIASPPGGAARGIVRVSGPDAVACVERCFSTEDRQPLTLVRRPTAVSGMVRIRDVTANLPAVLYLWPSSRSYTRQPTAEVHTLGSPPLLDALLSDLCAHGARLAQPGEFTLRAFLAGRIDLTQAEGVLGVIDARGRKELETALEQLSGGIATPLSVARGELLDLLAHLEAGLDFVEEDIEFVAREDLCRQLAAAHAQIEHLAVRMQSRGEAINAIRAVLVGAPNVGKSSLYNALTGQGALVSDQSGTTRDYLVARLDLGGVVCELVDTAGVGTAPDDRIQIAAMAATGLQRQQAEIEIVCVDATRSLTDVEELLLRQPAASNRIIVLTKTDQPRRLDGIHGAIETSSHTGAGLNQLRARLLDIGRIGTMSCTVVSSTAVRCRDILRQAADASARAQQLATIGAGEELVAAELRIALTLLGEVTGAICSDDILDRIFSRFCIGK